jgi:hypothetical protein
MSGHTPGPWKFAQDGDEPYWNVDMPMQDGSPGYGFANAMVYTTEEDARLIAAAPELLSELKLCCAILESIEFDDDADSVAVQDRVLLNALAVIAKAEGSARHLQK